ncbi:MAG: hypothetical protein KGJ23_11290 [Euryarchaeota archaeon]|nr:hypothetical protein [Euryarchaeota archaeon]MDE1837178.1 hypothetical protein [Euryarchaeota archaeon]MDE1881696.1 hypothetical protein [Euryarchaeota archaeon]MDE2045334.1 hypothetical protein [Thermoplasmata archaeon]
MRVLLRRDGAIALAVLNTWVAGAIVWTWAGDGGYAPPTAPGFYLGVAALLAGALAGFAGSRWRTRWVALVSGSTLGGLAAVAVPPDLAPVAGLGVGALAALWGGALCSMPLDGA